VALRLPLVSAEWSASMFPPAAKACWESFLFPIEPIPKE
jgi:hypothetical protein